MPAQISFIFESVGIGFSTGLAFFLLFIFINFIKEKLEEYKHKYIYKHRFDKQPIAKCYCYDCKYYDRTTNKCYGFDGYNFKLMADSWFCCFAEPREKEKIR